MKWLVVQEMESQVFKIYEFSEDSEGGIGDRVAGIILDPVHARLMAAAPELAEFARSMLGARYYGDGPNEMGERARVLLARIEGE